MNNEDPKIAQFTAINGRKIPKVPYKAGEILALHLATLHNVHFYCDLMQKSRMQIATNGFSVWKKELISKWSRSGAMKNSS